MNLYRFAVPLGILTLTLLAGAVLTGLSVRRVKNKRLMLRLHMALGLGALFTGLVHALIIFLAR